MKMGLVLLIAIALYSCMPAGRTDFQYVDFRPMGLEVIEVGEPDLSFYSGESIPLSYRAELDGIEIVIRPDLGEPYVAALNIAAMDQDAPRFVVVIPLQLEQGAFSTVRDRDNTVHAWWRQRSVDTDVSLTIQFEAGREALTLYGMIKTAGRFTYYDAL